MEPYSILCVVSLPVTAWLATTGHNKEILIHCKCVCLLFYLMHIHVFEATAMVDDADGCCGYSIIWHSGSTIVT